MDAFIIEIYIQSSCAIGTAIRRAHGEEDPCRHMSRALGYNLKLWIRVKGLVEQNCLAL